MLTVMIESSEDQAALAASLAALVPGAIEGLVREVVVIDRGLDAATREVADHAGCRIVGSESLATSVGAARGDWLLLLEPGARLQEGWIEAVATHVGDVEDRGRTPRAARFSRSRDDRPGFFQRFGQRRSALTEGLLLPKPQAVGLAARRLSLEDMAKGLASTRLEARLRPRAPKPRAT